MASIISGETYINPKNYLDYDSRINYFNFLRSNAIYDKGYELKEDKILNLITCTYERRNVRLVITTILKDDPIQ